MRFVKVVAKNHFEAGVEIGKHTKEKIHHFLSTPSNREKVERISESKDLLKSVQKECEEFSSELLDELEGMAKGSETPFEKLLAFNILDSIGNLPFSAIDCSSIVERHDSKVYFGHNEDWGYETNDLFVLDLQIQNTRIFAFTYYGLLPGISFSKNNHGLFFTMNGLICNDLRVGVPRSFVNRKVIQSRSIDEAIERIKMAKRSRGQNYNIFTKIEIANVETSATEMFVRRDLEFLHHTNHYTTDKMLKFENRKNPFVMRQSQMRLNTIEKLSKALNHLAPEERIKRILSSHENYPFTVCIHNLDFGKGKKVKTFATVVGTTDGKINVTFDNPCYDKFTEIDIEF
jgi:predicted choloylglycine hydrolase